MSSRNKHPSRPIPLIAIGMALGIGVVLAGEEELLSPTEFSPEVLETDLVSTGQLNRYVEALIEIETIQAEAIVKIEAADEAEAQSIIEKAEARILDAIYANDLTSTEYHELAAVVALDPDLQARVEEKRRIAELESASR